MKESIERGLAEARTGAVLNEVFDSSQPLRTAAITELSDLDRAEIALFRERWAAVAAERRREIIGRMAELAEDNFDLSFEKVFLNVLSDPDPMVRAAAASGLVLSEDGEVATRLVRMLTDDRSGPVRVAAALSLGKFVLQAERGEIPDSRVDRVRNALLAIIADRGQSAELRRRALESISAWSSPQVTDLIASAYRSAEPGFKASAIYAMGMNCDARWLPALFAEMGDPNAKVRYEAAHAAGEIGEPSAVSHLLPLLNDSDVEVRTAAIWALGQIGGKAAQGALRGLARDPNEKVRQAVEEALSEITFHDGSISL